jgi:hypothetical protein
VVADDLAHRLEGDLEHLVLHERGDRPVEPRVGLDELFDRPFVGLGLVDHVGLHRRGP